MAEGKSEGKVECDTKATMGDAAMGQQEQMLYFLSGIHGAESTGPERQPPYMLQEDEGIVVPARQEEDGTK